MVYYKVLLLFVAILHAVNAQSNGALRLENGNTPHCGRVEVFYDGRWGTICSDGWNKLDAEVVCKQLEYGRVLDVYKNAHFGEGQGPIWLDNLNCVRDSSSILECGSLGWGVHNCQHSQDAGVCCEKPLVRKPLHLPVRLRCPKCNEGGSCNTSPNKRHPSPSDCQSQAAVRGIVEVEVDGQWGPVSAVGWGINETTVVCGQLGYPMAFPSGDPPPTIRDVWPDYGSEEGSGTQCEIPSLTETESYRDSLNETYIQGVKCSGSEARLVDCSMSGIGTQPNPSRTVAVVQCGYRPHISCSRSSSKIYRLRGGAVPWVGRVEMKMNGEWGTICDTGFDAKEGNMICRNLGYGTVKYIVTRAGYGRGVGKIHLTELECTGRERNIQACRYQQGIAAQRCGHEGDVGIECNVPDASPDRYMHKVRMLEETDSGFIQTYPEIVGSIFGWGLFCHSDTPMVNTHVGEVICRETKGQFLSRIYKGNRPTNYRGLSYHGTINCTGDEVSISECSVELQTWAWCPQKYTIVDCNPRAPDLVPDLYQFRLSLEYWNYIYPLPLQYLTCAAEEGCLSSSAYGALPNSERYLLQFASKTWNWGSSDFLPVDPPSEWEWHTCHSHFHSMQEFVHYDLLDDRTGAKVAEGHKASFCLEDTGCAQGYSARYRCFLGHQGISVNCQDTYGSHLDCQWIDITGVPGGTYILQQTLNPQHLVIESDYRNNQISCRITINNDLRSHRTHNCWLSDHEGTSTRE